MSQKRNWKLIDQTNLISKVFLFKHVHCKWCSCLIDLYILLCCWHSSRHKLTTIVLHFQRLRRMRLYDFRMLVIPRVPSRGGKHSGFSGLILNFCKNLVKKRKISILANDSPRQILRPVNKKQFEIYYVELKISTQHLRI